MAQRQHNANLGDLIEIFRPGYQHWAVYVGNDEVVHLTSPDYQGSSSSGNLFGFSSSGGMAVVKCENIWKVASFCDFKVNNLLDFKYVPRHPYVIMKAAFEMVGAKFGYSLMEANCEHFATVLRYGAAESRQAIVAASVAQGYMFFVKMIQDAINGVGAAVHAAASGLFQK